MHGLKGKGRYRTLVLEDHEKRVEGDGEPPVWLERRGGMLNLAKTVWLLTCPVLFGRLVQTLANLIDIAMVGSLGAAATAAVGMGRQLTLFSELSMHGVVVGAMTLTAHFIGERSPQKVSVTSRQSLVMGALISLLLGGLGALFSRHLLILLGAEGEVLALGTGYTRIYFAGLVFMMTSYLPWALLQGAGDTVTAFYLLVLINVLHVVLDYLFIYGVGILPPMGVNGAALGTIVSRLVGTFVGLAVLYSRRSRVALLPGTSYRPNWRMMWRILRIGVPMSIGGMVTSGAALLFLRILAATPAATVGLAAYAIGLRLGRVSFFAASAFSVAALSLVGQNLGDGQVEEAYRSGWIAGGLGVFFMSTAGLILFFLATPLVDLFTNDPLVIRAGADYLRIVALAQPFSALTQVIGGALQGAGDTKPLLHYAVITQWLISLPLAYILIFPLGMGVSGAWYAIAASAIVQGLLVASRFQSGSWKKVRV